MLDGQDNLDDRFAWRPLSPPVFYVEIAEQGK